MDECDRRVYQKADASLSRVYNKLMSKFDEPQKAMLGEAQRAWIKFRNANCALASDFVYQQCLTAMTMDRTIELEGFKTRFLMRR
jgi:uncharacterized protein YecT (DUF1311 family)